MIGTHRVRPLWTSETAEAWQYETRRESDASSAAWKDAKGLLILLAVGCIVLTVWAYGVVRLAEWVRGL